MWFLKKGIKVLILKEPKGTFQGGRGVKNRAVITYIHTYIHIHTIT